MHRRFLILSIITLLIMIAESASDIYAPCLPNICISFATHESIASLTMSVNLLGLALSGLIYGPLSDAIGRRRVMLFGWFIFSLGSLACGYAKDISMLILFRFVQGFGGGTALVIGLAIVSDLYQGERCAKIISRLGMVIALSPGLGPVVGSFIVTHYTWTMVFWLVSSVSLILWVATLFILPETKIRQEKQALDLRHLFMSYQRVLSNSSYWIFALIQILTITWLWGELANLPFIFMSGMALPVNQYGYFMAFSVATYVGGTLINQRWLESLGILTMIKIGIWLTVMSSFLLLIGHHVSSLTPWIILALKIPSSLGIAFIFGNATAKALESSHHDQGTGSALLSACQMIGGSLGIYGVSFFYDGTILPLAFMIAGCSLIALILIHTKLRNFKAS